MYYNKIYYVLDTISETIIGSFYAKSDRMAKKMMDTFDFNKANLSRDDVLVIPDPKTVPICETFYEVVNNDWPSFDFSQQKLLDFEVSNGQSDK